MSGSAVATEEPSDSGIDFGGWTPTGRKTVAPDSELIEVENPDGHKQTAIVYDKTWREHDLLTTNVELVQSFMEFPMVEGIACLTRAPLRQGLFQYETGSVLALIEVLRAYRDQRNVIGIKAAVEMLKAVAAMLQEASENGPMQGIYSHGGITPWRIALDADGDVQLLGYGLPQMDMVALREDSKLKVRDDSYKYCPPERLTSGYEDITTDMFSLVLIAYEMATGEPLLTGRSAELKKSVEMGEAQGKLITNPGGLPSPIHGAFVHALAFDPIGRYQEPREFMAALVEAEGQVKLKGDTLADVMAQVRKTTRRGKALMDVGTAGGPRRAQLDGDRATRMKSATDARPVRGRSAAGKKDASVQDAGRWGKVARSGQGDEDEETSKSGRSVAGRPTRRRRGAAESDSKPEGASARPARRRTTSTDEDDATPSRRTRLRSSRSTDDEAEKPARARPSRLRSSRAAPDKDEDDKKDAPKAEKPTRSRRSRSAATDDDDDKKDAPKAEKPTRSRRSRASSTDDDDDEKKDAPKAEKKDAPKAEKPTRSRRSRSAATDDDDDKKDAPKAEKPTRSRRSRASSTDDDDDEKKDAPKAEKPTRSRRSRASSPDDDDDKKDAPKAEKPTRSRRSRASSTDDDDKKDAPKAKKPTRSRRSRTKSED